jgi:SAM-dependent methyltransferase
MVQGKVTHFGQGADVNRARPHIFHRDYWALRAVVEAVSDFFREHEAEIRGKQILDYGAGDSPYKRLAQNAGAKLLSADIVSRPGVIPISTAGRVELADESVDAIISTQVLEHVPDVQLYLREALRVLRPGGPLFLSTHGGWILHRVPTDYRRWTTDGLAYELGQAGFRVKKVTPAVGILAASTHLRAILVGGMLRRVPFAGWLRPLIYLVFNIRMGLEELITPLSVMNAHPELLFATARKPSNGRTQQENGKASELKDNGI